jgi:thioredoxin-related protein
VNGRTNSAAFIRYSIVWACFLLLASNIVLLRANRRLAAARDEFQAKIELQKGARLSALTAKTFDDKDATVSFGRDERRTLILIYSPACVFCEENWPNWDRIVAAIKGDKVRLVAVDLSNLTQPDYAAAHKLDRFLLLRHPAPQTILDYRLRSTPQTILADSSGKVELSRVGLLENRDVAEILSALRSNQEEARR